MKTRKRYQKKKQTRRKRRGGVRLGEGKRGVVVKPAIPCKGKDTTGYVSKVFKTWTDTRRFGHPTYTAEEEFKKVKERLPPVIEILKKIDPEQKHFLYPEFCEEFGELTDGNKADGITDESKQYSYLMKEGGYLTLVEVAKRSYETEIIEYLKDIQEKLKMLHDNKIIHGDLVPQNVLQMPDGTFRIIDFDSARVVTDEDLKDVMYSFGPQPSKTREFMEEEILMLIEDVAYIADLDYDELVKRFI